MKKNKMMRLASCLLVAVMLTTSVISGTFAKYVTTNAGADSARVAKWGVEVEVAGTSFADKYEKDDGSISLNAYSVESLTDKVVAPGTKGELAYSVLSGTPEVAVRVTHTADLNLTDWSVNSLDYCPIIFTVDDTTYGLEGIYYGDTATKVKPTNTYSTVAALEIAVEEAIANHSKDYEANTNLGNIDEDGKLKVSWEWNFVSYTSESGAANYDVQDTALGDASTPAKITLNLNTTVTQID